MEFTLQHLLPRPLADTPLAEGSCWKTEISIDSNSNYLVEAPSGTGKTTLVSILFGLRNDYAGSVLLDGKNTREFSPEEWAQLRREMLAVVFQELRLFPQLTALENIRIKNTLTNTLTEEEIGSMAETLGIAHRLQQPCGTLSLGQQQRVAILRALAQPFRFLLLDEPFSHLDEENAQKAMALINAACAKNKAGILLTSLAPVPFFHFDRKIII